MKDTTTAHKLQQAARALDQSAHAALARSQSGLSPVSLTRSWVDWLLNLSVSPGTQARLATQAQQFGIEWLAHAWHSSQHKSACEQAHPEAANENGIHVPTTLVQALACDPRFNDPAWDNLPWSALAAANKGWEMWWQQAANLRGMDPHSSQQLLFFARQWLDMTSPGNALWSNPQALQKAWDTQGESLLKGMGHAVDRWRQRLSLPPLNHPQSALAPGAGLAMTPGQVVFRNDLIELIQYQPSTDQVQAEPLLIIPSCIMKYYILDLSPHNSMVRWLVEQGHTVYIVSWRNPNANDALLELDDYVRQGVLAALEHVSTATAQPVHLAGYCLGGTLVAIAAAYLQARQTGPTDFSPALASVTLLAAQTEFSEPGEMGVLIDTAQVGMLEDLMAEQGFLSGRQMAGSFQFLHSRELIWSQRARALLLGEPPYSNDLMVWNADVTRLPAVMHSQSLRRLYLGDDLAEGRYRFDDEPVSLRSISAPMFVVGTAKDHVSPWRSVFKVHQLVNADVTFVLTNGGHNAGIVSEPGHAGRRYQLHTTLHKQTRPTPDQWAATASHHQGSWWQAWSAWLAAQASTADRVAARQPPQNPALGPAPGRYVMQRYGD